MQILMGLIVFLAIWSWMVVIWIILPSKATWVLRAIGAMLLGGMAGSIVTQALRNPATFLLGMGMTGSAVIAGIVSVRWYATTQLPKPDVEQPRSTPPSVSPTVFRTKPSGVLNQRLAQRSR